jgi:hypothetical protein
MTTPNGDGAVAVEIARLRGEMTTGFAEIKGQLDVIVQAQAANSQDIAELDKRVSALEARRWPIGSVAALSGAVSAVVAAVAFAVGQ